MGFKMKYEIKKQYLTAGSKRRSGIRMPEVDFNVAHDTGNPGSTAAGNVGYYERSRNEMYASAAVFVDDKDIIECIPLLTSAPEKAWHVLYNVTTDNEMYGDDANDVAGSFELCWGGDINPEEAYKRFVWVLAYASYKFKLNPAKTIVGHDVLDPRRKIDPSNALKRMGKTTADLIKDVIAEYNDCLAKPVAKPAPAIDGATHTIEAGDTFWNIAQRTKGVSVQDLIAWNPTVSAADLKVGQKINLKKPEVKSVGKPISSDTYTIVSGDSFWSIAGRKEGVTVDNLIAWNPSVNPKQLKVGQKINVKKPAASKKPAAPAKKKFSLPKGPVLPGHSGEATLLVQKALCAVYFYPDKGAKNNGCDGHYGPKTENAVRRFQSVHCNPIDGMAGPKTLAKLDQLLNK
jgi:LysM repeat protein